MIEDLSDSDNDHCDTLHHSQGDKEIFSPEETPQRSQNLFLSGSRSSRRVAALSERTLSEVSTVIASATQETSQNKFGVLQGATIDDIELVGEAIYPIESKSNSEMTRIKAIKGHAVSKIQSKCLDEWGRMNGVKIPRKMKKKVDVCRLITEFKMLKDRQDAQAAAGKRWLLQLPLLPLGCQ